MKFSMINSARIVLFTAYFLLVCISPITSVDARAAFPKLYLTQQEFEQSIKSLKPALHQHILQKKKLFLSLIAQLLKEPESWAILVDKGNKISPSYGPTKFVDLSAYGWAHVTRAGLKVSTEILPDLEKMIRAATKDNITLTIGSAYRSYAYQQQVHRRLIQQLGEKAAQRLSSPAGASQHQLGTVVDFYPISQSFTGTQAQLWLAKHACQYGFSLSYPKGHENKTGYAYESWHYRYIGYAACTLQNEFFDGLQYELLSWWNVQKIFYAQKVFSK